MAYLDKSVRETMSPAGVGLTALVNGGLVAALVLIAPTGVVDLPVILQGYVVEEPAPPPLPPVEDKAEIPKPHLTPSKPETAPLAAAPGDVLEMDLGASSGDGGDIGAQLPPPPPPPPDTGVKPVREPVFIQPRPDPRFADRLQPPYPTSMIRAGLGGVVVVRVLVGADGRVKAVEPVSASDDAFLRVTREQALSKWRFAPATRDGAAVESWREMTVRFVLPD